MSDERRIAVALRIDEPFPHHQDVLSGVFDYAREHPGWRCVVDEYPSYSASGHRKHTKAYDGVIARASPELQERLARLGIPLVNIWYEHASPSVPGVYPDTTAIGRSMADHLINRGHRRLAFIGGLEHRRDKEIATAFASAAAERGCRCVLENCAPATFGDREAWFTLQQRVEDFCARLDRPIGVFAITAIVARIIMTICQDSGQRRTRDVGVVCLDNVKTIVELSPQITSIDCNYFRVGQVAAEYLGKLMSGLEPKTPMRFIQPKGVVPRASTASFAATDEVVAAALQYISDHLRNPLSLDEIAGAIATSPRSLQRRFEAVMGCPVSDEIRRLRIDVAQRLLGENKLTANQIARKAGFSSAVTMNHAFHREVGMSPTAYRKKAQGD